MRLAAQPEFAFWRRIWLAPLAEYLVLYAVLVGYGVTYEYFFADQLTQIFHNDFMTYDFSRPTLYRLTEFLTPLALLPIGTKLNQPAQYIVGLLSVFVFIPTPMIFIQMVNTSEYWHVYSLLWLGYLITSTLSSMSVAHRVPTMPDETYNRAFYWVAGLFVLGIGYAALTNHLSFVGLDDAEQARKDVNLGLLGYVTNSYSGAFGGLFLGMALMRRKLILALGAIAGFVICYGVLSLKSTALTPAWIAFIYFAHRYFFRNSMVKYYLTLIAPFLFGLTFLTISGHDNRHTLAYYVFTAANFRLYTVPGIAFNIYYNFFQMHPVTYGSHVNIVSKFISYPYLEPLSLLMADYFHMGNYNASFIATDGVASGGVTGIPFAALVFGLAMVGINSCLRGLNPTLIAVVFASPALILIDVGLGSGLLTNGLGTMALFLLFAPRDAVWNIRYLATGPPSHRRPLAMAAAR